MSQGLFSGDSLFGVQCQQLAEEVEGVLVGVGERITEGRWGLVVTELEVVPFF